MAVLSQYANSIINFSSQYSTTLNSATQALGAPDTSAYGDFGTAWAAVRANSSTPETLTVGFATAVYANTVTIRENNGNGFVTKIEVLSTDNTYTQVWAGTDTATINTVADFTVTFTQTTFLVKGVKITIDINHSMTAFEEIDAVKLIGNDSNTTTNHAPTNLSLSKTNIDENVAANTVIGTFSSTDADTANSFSYSLISGTGSTDNSAFTISANQLKIKASPNFEAKSSYSILVRTTDQGGLSFDKILTISVNDINENMGSLLNQYANSIINFSSQFSTTLNAATQALGAPDTSVYGDFTSAWAASSADSNTAETLTVGFATPVYANAVTIRENNGNGFVTKIEVLSTDNTYTQVWAGTDTATINTVANFTVSFTQTTFLVKGVKITVDTNYALGVFEEIDAVRLSGYSVTTDTNHAPTNLSLSKTNIDENVAANTVIGTFSSTDADTANSFSYSLISGTGSTDNSAFTISANQLKIKVSPNFEAKSSYSILVRTTDQGGLSFDKILTISVNDITEAGVRIIGDLNDIANNDSIKGGDGADRLYGGDLNDSLYGSYGNDRLYGEDGNDVLYGQNANDRLEGGNNNDTLYGSFGADTLTGGAGTDIFVFDTAPSNSSIDRLTDFSTVSDTIRLENSVFTVLTTTGVLAASAFNISTAAVDSSDRLIYNNNTGALYYDQDGTGAQAAIQIALLGTGLALTAADFIVS